MPSLLSALVLPAVLGYPAGGLFQLLPCNATNVLHQLGIVLQLEAQATANEIYVVLVYNALVP